MKKMFKSVLNTLICSTVLLSFGCSSNESDLIKIGGIAPLSGQVAVYGVECKNGIDLAIEEINAAGGVNGKQLTFICEDDEGDSGKSVNAYNKLVTKDGVRLIIGSLTSSCTLSFTQRSQAQKVVQIAPAATAVDITNAGNFIFRTCYTDPFQGRVGGKFAREYLKANTAAILYDIGNDYSVGLTENFENEFVKIGGKIVSKESYNTGDKDFNAQLTKIKASKPEVVYLPDYYGTVALIAKQLRAQGIDVPIIGADGWDGLVENAGLEVVEGYYSNHYSEDSDNPLVQKFVSAFKAKYNKSPNSFAALGYDSVYMLKDAILKAGSADPIKVRECLEMTDGDYVTGHIVFDENRNPLKQTVMISLVKGDDGKLATRYAATVNID